VLAATGGTGVDVAVEAVGRPATFDICQAILAPGGQHSHARAASVRVDRKENLFLPYPRHL
jgi:alcohol dehydrogenase